MVLVIIIIIIVVAIFVIVFINITAMVSGVIIKETVKVVHTTLQWSVNSVPHSPQSSQLKLNITLI